jgi:Beta-Casp domain
VADGQMGGTACRFLKLCHSREDVAHLPQGPKVVLCTLPDLEAGIARQIFVEWAPDPRNLIIFPGRPQVRLIDRPCSKHPVAFSSWPGIGTCCFHPHRRLGLCASKRGFRSPVSCRHRRQSSMGLLGMTASGAPFGGKGLRAVRGNSCWRQHSLDHPCRLPTCAFLTARCAGRHARGAGAAGVARGGGPGVAGTHVEARPAGGTDS